MAKRKRQTPTLEERATPIAALFKALSDATRVRILSSILDEERCVHELCEELELEQSAVSHQLRVLRDNRLVQHRKEGRHVYYALDDKHIRALLQTAFEHVGRAQ